MAAISKAIEYFRATGGFAAPPQSAEQEARAAETKAVIEGILKAQESMWHGKDIPPSDAAS
jgi:hypothetical protein